ncbi:MAG: FAD-binding oxidoreductase [Patescibacteria group bacterium]|nr:FAD-binding oxidoreductase [Patescibacteria group bacterium]
MVNQIQRARVLRVRKLGETTYVLRLERNGFEFVPGQCVNLGLPNKAINREYSTYSGVNDSYLEFLIKRVEGGAVSPDLCGLEEGQEVSLDGAYGLFVLNEPGNLNQRYVFVGSGTGIAPFHSYIKSYPNLNYRVLHGVRQVSDQYDREDYESGRYVSCVSRGGGGDFSGRVTDYLKSHEIDKEAVYYLCGNSSMINEVYDILRSVNVSGSQIFTEVFF